MEDGIIKLDTEFAQKIGFTSDKFDGYLWKNGNYITISFIISKKPKQGNFKRLLDAIESKGYGIEVPTPFARMRKILLDRGGFKVSVLPFDEEHGINDPCEVWIKEVNKI
jgi:hypothetical protein